MPQQNKGSLRRDKPTSRDRAESDPPQGYLRARSDPVPGRVQNWIPPHGEIGFALGFAPSPGWSKINLHKIEFYMHASAVQAPLVAVR